MMEFGLSKKQVLEGFFIREIPLLIYKMKMRQRYKTLEKLYDQRLYLLIASATAGMAPNPEMIQQLLEDIQKSISRLVSGSNEPEDMELKKPEDPYERLKQLQNVIIQTHKGTKLKK